MSQPDATFLAMNPAPVSEREIVTRRLFGRPRADLYRAFSDPGRLARWWGPAGLTSTFREFDLRPGGHWRFTMHGPDGTDCLNNILFEEVILGESIRLRHLDAGHEFELTILFAEREGKTELAWRMLFPTKEKRDLVQSFVGPANEQNFDRLEAELAHADEAFVITRVFDAPRPVVWKAWTDRDELLRWFGPQSMPIAKATLELRPGGQFHYCLRLPDGKALWLKWTFREIEAPSRFLAIVAFANEHGDLERHPMSPTYPLETISEVTFAQEGDRTRFTLRKSPWRATEEERQAYPSFHALQEQGWAGCFAQLDTYLAHL